MRRRSVAVAAFAVVVGLVQVPSGTAAAEGFGTVRGRVVDGQTGAGIAGACVGIHDAETFESLAFGQTAADGRYEFTNVRSGAHIAIASDCNESDEYQYIPEIYKNKGFGEPQTLVNVLDGIPTTGIDFTLKRGGTIIVRLVDEAGQPLTFDPEDTDRPVVCPEYLDAASQSSFCTGPDEGGVAYLRGVLRRSKIHAFGSGIVGEYFKNQPDHASAKAVYVGVNEVQEITMRVATTANARTSSAASGPTYTPMLAPAAG